MLMCNFKCAIKKVYIMNAKLILVFVYGTQFFKKNIFITHLCPVTNLEWCETAHHSKAVKLRVVPGQFPGDQYYLVSCKKYQFYGLSLDYWIRRSGMGPEICILRNSQGDSGAWCSCEANLEYPNDQSFYYYWYFIHG